jgi:Na+/H+ antiporter NhaC
MAVHSRYGPQSLDDLKYVLGVLLSMGISALLTMFALGVVFREWRKRRKIAPAVAATFLAAAPLALPLVDKLTLPLLPLPRAQDNSISEAAAQQQKD